jgi:hypothetical protein
MQGATNFVFPEHDLMVSLIDLYFKCINWMLPILHRPTFERSISEGLHIQDASFASTLLMVCAVAARYSDDRRVLMDGTDIRHSAGWTWFDQVRVMRRSLLSPPSLYELQFYCVSYMFRASRVS